MNPPLQLSPVIAAIVFAATYLVLAIGRLPGFRIDRTGAAIIGAGAMIGFNILTFDEAVKAVDFSTIGLLFGMMIVVANLRLSGFFRLVSSWAVRHAHAPLALLGSVVLVSGIFSAFFVNDTMCIVLTPLVLAVAGALGRNPVPYLLGVAMASNAGSAATITGNPQNMMIGSLSRIPYVEFAAALAPVAAFGLAATFAVIAVAFRAEFRRGAKVEVAPVRVRINRILMVKALAVSAGMIALFFSGWPVAKVALVAGALLLITRRVKPEKVYHEIDFGLLVMFAGLFIVVAGLEKSLYDRNLLGMARTLGLDRTGILATASGLLSNVVSNVPAVLVFRPLLGYLPDPHIAWLTLAMSSTLAGNLTILGSVANLIVVERAKHEAPLSFWQYFRVGAPLTVITVAFGVFWLSL
ncbi:MAG TPA: anion transporter [Bryobacteraceae bacterium]|nr:anion transporter [Bryobacteraceae bacterium]